MSDSTSDSVPPHMNPMSPEEVRELLTACLHGPLPQATVQRMMATLAEWMPKQLNSRSPGEGKQE